MKPPACDTAPFRHHATLVAALLIGAGLAPAHAADGDALRDPMRPPALHAAAPAASAAATDAAAPAVTRHLIVSGGRRWIVEQGRRYSEGDLLDGARIERIDEHGVVVRGAGGSQRLPLYGPVVKRAADETPTASPAAAPKSARRGAT